ncbi:MAG: LysM peptidoglycan-binding domain-containing protein [Lapillicoccus sp.]
MALAVVGLAVTAVVSTFFLEVVRSTLTTLQSPVPADPADVLVCGLAAGGGLLTAWLGLGFAASALSALPGALGTASRLVAHHVAPAAVRHATAVLLGTALVASVAGGSATAASLDPESSGPPGSWATSQVVAPDPAFAPSVMPSTANTAIPSTAIPSTAIPSPTTSVTTSAFPSTSVPSPATAGPTTGTTGRTASTQPRIPASGGSLGPLGPAAQRSQEAVVVRAGDTLWDLAARRLGPHATVAQVADEWPRWYAVNQSVVGDDPDLLLPGQQLVVPSLAPDTTGPDPTGPAS